jgi:hypothetical protein
VCLVEGDPSLIPGSDVQGRNYVILTLAKFKSCVFYRVAALPFPYPKQLVVPRNLRILRFPFDLTQPALTHSNELISQPLGLSPVVHVVSARYIQISSFSLFAYTL